MIDAGDLIPPNTRAVSDITARVSGLEMPLRMRATTKLPVLQGPGDFAAVSDAACVNTQQTRR